MRTVRLSHVRPARRRERPASQQDIEKYFDTMHIRDMMNTLMSAMTKQAQQMMHEQIQKQPNLPPGTEARLDKLMDDSIKDLPIDELLKVMIPVYQKHLTKSDVDALTTFYSSPTGQRILREMPAMTTEAMQASSGIMQKMMAKAMQRAQDEIAQLQKTNGRNVQELIPVAIPYMSRTTRLACTQRPWRTPAVSASLPFDARPIPPVIR
jgi:hypothetical protein